MDVKNQLKNLTSEIKSITGVYKARFALRRLKNNDIKKVGISFPDVLLDYLENGPRLDLSFAYNKSDAHIFGSTIFFFTEEMRSKKEAIASKYPFFNNEFTNRPEVLVLASLGYLHYVFIEVLVTNYILWLVLPNGEKYKIDATVKEYIDFLLITRGIYLGEAYLCPDFPKELLINRYDGFYHNMNLLFNISPDELPQCYHKNIVKNVVPAYKHYGKSLHEEFKKMFEAEIQSGTCSISPGLDEKHERIQEIFTINAIEINTDLWLPKAYRQLCYDFGYSDLKITRTTSDGRFLSITFIYPIDVFIDLELPNFSVDLIKLHHKNNLFLLNTQIA